MGAADMEYLLQIAQEAERAGHNGKGAIYARACEFLGIAPATLHRRLKEVRVTNPRKRRSDAGNHALPLEEAQVLSAYLMEGYRKNNKKVVSIKEAVQSLRANGRILAGRVDTETGEFVPLSVSAIARALYAYCLHPEQLRRPPPHIHLQSEHPNHVWQVDASVCTLYYLPTGEALIETHKAVHYKNKPENLAAIAKERVIRYVVTDHCSGVIRWRYYPHAESGEHTVRFLAWAMLPKGKLSRDPFHGAPFIVQVDPGATSAGLVQRFCERLTITLEVNMPGAPRSKGSVEKAQDIVETNFEQGLRFCGKHIRSIDELNALADTVQVWFNATAEHTRHKMPRFEAWMRIRQEQLRVIPAGVDLLSLATSKPETRVVNGSLMIEYMGGERFWRVGHLPGAMVGGEVVVCHNPLDGRVMAVTMGEDGRETHIELPEATRNEWGFFDGSATIGKNFASHPDTVLDTNRKIVSRIAAGEASIEAAEKKRKRRDFEPFDGQVDPFKTAKETQIPELLPRHGQVLADVAPRMDYQLLTHAQALIKLRKVLGRSLEPEENAWVTRRYPDGVPEEAMEGLIEQFSGDGVATETPAGGLMVVR